MANVFTNVNMVAFNRPQLRAVARALGVPHDNASTNAALITAIRAK